MVTGDQLDDDQFENGRDLSLKGYQWREETCESHSPWYLLDGAERRNMRAFEGLEDNFDRVRDRWFLTLSFLIIGHSLYTMENFEDLIVILINM